MPNVFGTKCDLRTTQTAIASRPTVLLIIRVHKMFADRTSLSILIASKLLRVLNFDSSVYLRNMLFCVDPDCFSAIQVSVIRR